MTSDEPQPSQPRPASPKEDDWGDLWGVDGPTEGGEESSKTTQPESVEIWESDKLPPRRDAIFPRDVSDSASPVQEAGTQRRRASQLKVREIAGDTADRMKSQPSGIDTLKSKDVSLEEITVDRQGIEEKEWSQPTVFSLKWVIPITFAVIALIVGALVMLQRSHSNRQQSTKSGVKHERHQLVAALDAEIKDLLERQNEARKMYAYFAGSQVIEEILPMIRNSAEIRGLILQTGHQRLVDKQWLPDDRAKWTMHLLRTRPFACLSGDLPDFSPFRAYFVVEGGALVMDWKATTTYSTASFADLAKGKGNGSEVRGLLKPAALYTTVWPEDQYHCYQFESPDKQEMIWCYAKRSSVEASKVGRFFLKGEIVQESDRVLPMTLKLSKGPDSGLPNQWRIEDLIHEEWIEIQ